MKRILVLDGGGVKGFIQLAILKQMEQVLQHPLCQVFDLIVGTSVGAILGGIISTGKLSMAETNTIMHEVMPQMMIRRFRLPLYIRIPFNDAFNHEIGGNICMNACATKFMCTSVNMVDGKTHFFKSWEENDGQLKLLDAISHSYAAPLYFGAIVDKKRKAVWLDGGVGNANCPLPEAYIECMRQQWLENDHVHILSLGTGWHNYWLSYEQGKKIGALRQVLFFIDPAGGGLAHNQSTRSRVRQIKTLAKLQPKMSFQRIDRNIDRRLDKHNAVRFIDKYVAIGKELAGQVDYGKLGKKEKAGG